MDPNWLALEPHRPVDVSPQTYVERPFDSGQVIADLILAGKSTVLVAGPVGVGKSTEIATTARSLAAHRLVGFAPMDRAVNMRRITADRALVVIAGFLAFAALKFFNLKVSPALRSAITQQGVAIPGLAPDPDGKITAFQGSPNALLHATVEEVTRLSSQGRAAILLDGTEKLGVEGAAELFDALAGLPDKLDLVVVVPWHAAFGPRADDVLRPGERLISIRALPVEGPSGANGRQFLRQVLEHRLAPASIPSDVLTLADRAAELSGGIPRMFLQLMADAATNARLRRRGPWPTPDDLKDAAADMRDSFRRILLPGDIEALRAVDGTDGLEMPLDRKIRLLAHAALLERASENGPVMEPHPLVRALLGGSSTNA
jgi:hypothetical protein